MSKRIRLVLIAGIVLLVGYFLVIQFKDDSKEIERMVHSINEPLLSVIHVEFLDNNHAIAFYEANHNGELYFGSAVFKKGLFGWKSLGSSSGQIPKDKKLDWGFSSLDQMGLADYTDLVRGKVLVPEIEKVRILTKEGNEYEAKIIEYNNRDRFWFMVTKGENLLGATIQGISTEGKVIEEL